MVTSVAHTRFVLYSGEEQGLFGSEGYVRDHAEELDRVSVVMTHDAGGTYLAGIDATYAMLDDTASVCAPLVDLDPRFPFEIREVDGIVNSGDSDHAPFIAAGVPSFFWHQSEEDYEHVHHTQYDTFEESTRRSSSTRPSSSRSRRSVSPTSTTGSTAPT